MKQLSSQFSCARKLIFSRGWRPWVKMSVPSASFPKAQNATAINFRVKTRNQGSALIHITDSFLLWYLKFVSDKMSFRKKNKKELEYFTFYMELCKWDIWAVESQNLSDLMRFARFDLFSRYTFNMRSVLNFEEQGIRDFSLATPIRNPRASFRGLRRDLTRGPGWRE